MSYETGDLRNIALVGHSDSGKTSFVDATAHLAGLNSRRGSTAEGSSICDFEPEEKERKHSLASAIVHLPWKKKVINFIDCPGYPDFIGEAISALHVVETGILSIGAHQGVSFTARNIYARMEEAGVARAILISKMDVENANFSTLLSKIREAFGDRCVPITFPDGNGTQFTRVISALRTPVDTPAALKDQASLYYNTLVESVAESDDFLMERYLEKGEISREDLEKNLGKAMVQGKLIPIFVVDSLRGIGVSETLNAIEEFFPSPLIRRNSDGEFAAYVFKTLSDPYVGKISYFRVFRGTLPKDGHFHSAKHPKIEKAHPHAVVGKDLKALDRLIPGDIAAIPKVEALDSGDTFFAEGSEAISYPKPKQPKPMTALAVEPKSHNDEQKIGMALHKLEFEDPTFRVHRESQTHETIIEGLSDLHLQVMLSRLKRRFHVEVNVHLPKIPYKEAILGKAEGHYRHRKQSGGRGQFGECFLRVEALARGKGFEFVNEVFGGAIPRQFIPAIEKGIHETMEKGVIAGCQIIDVKVAVYDGKFHDVDSDEISFKIAGAHAFSEAFMRARPTLLEPVMDVEISIPTHFLGAITGDLNSRRGHIVGMDSQGDVQILHAQVPQAELLQYASQLRSITAGEGSFTMSFSRYEPVPHHIQEKVVTAFAATKQHAAGA